MNLRDDLVSFSDYVWGRLAERLDGLSDEEYFWEPVGGCWSILPASDGSWSWEAEWPEPQPPPLTTIAWRLTHLTTPSVCAGGLREGNPVERFRSWLGLSPCPDRSPRAVPPSAQAALAAVSEARAEMRGDLLEVDDAVLAEPIGAVGGPYGEASRATWVHHVLDEVIHHGAEVALLRDLYRAAFAPSAVGSQKS